MKKLKNKIGYLALGTMFAFAGVFGGAMIAGCSNPNTTIQEEREIAQDGISIFNAFKTQYYINEDLDVTGGIINYTTNGQTIQVVITNDMITGFTSATTGTRPLVITYENHTTTVNYTINDYLPFLTTNAVYKSTQRISYNGENTYIKFKIYGASGNKFKICPVTENSSTFEAYDNVNYSGWYESYVTEFELNKTFKNGSWTAIATISVHPHGGEDETVTTITLTNITETSCHLSFVQENSWESAPLVFEGNFEKL